MALALVAGTACSAQAPSADLEEEETGAAESALGSDVEWRVSTDTTITAADFPSGVGPVPPLNPGQCAPVSINGYASAPPGAYYLGVVVDPTNSVPELIETNDTLAGGSIVVN